MVRPKRTATKVTQNKNKNICEMERKIHTPFIINQSEMMNKITNTIKSNDHNTLRRSPFFHEKYKQRYEIAAD